MSCKRRRQRWRKAASPLYTRESSDVNPVVRARKALKDVYHDIRPGYGGMDWLPATQQLLMGVPAMKFQDGI
jgi:hypothetical protein